MGVLGGAELGRSLAEIQSEDKWPQSCWCQSVRAEGTESDEGEAQPQGRVDEQK